MMQGMMNPRVSKPTKAIWSLKSSDKRWCDEGAFIYKGMRGIPLEASYRIEELKAKYNEPPEDLMWGFKLVRDANTNQIQYKNLGSYYWVSFKWYVKGFFNWIVPPGQDE